jgi:hypothetical protein
MAPRGWKAFERLVAAIHRAESADAVVTWNDSIADRQFDVTLRFRRGLYTFLVVIECKDTSSRVPVKEVEAFVTKAADVSANKAVIASTGGFQEGCKSVAERHGVTLLTISPAFDVPADLLGPPIEMLCICDVRLNSDDLNEITLEEENGKLHWLLNQTLVRYDRGQTTLRDIVDGLVRRDEALIGRTERVIQFDFRSPVTATLPDRQDPIVVRSVRFSAAVVDGHGLKGLNLEPSTIGRAYAIRDELAGTSSTVPAKGLKVGEGTPPVPGRFFYSPGLGFSYYCAALEADLVHWLLVESYQHGKLIQASFTQKLEHAGSYVEITDSTEISRLQHVLKNSPVGERASTGPIAPAG